MKKLIFPLFGIALIFSSCQQGLTGYEGDLFLPQNFTTTCMEELDSRPSTEVSPRDFSLKPNGDLIRKNPNGQSFFFKNASSVSMMSDDVEGFCILWLARDLTTQQDVTIFLYNTSVKMVYESGEACHYRMACNEGEEYHEEISLIQTANYTYE